MAQRTRKRRLGPFSSSLASLSHLALEKHVYYLNIVVSNKNSRNNNKKNLPMAQTTQNVSFGPVFIMVGFHKPPHTCKTLIVSKYIS